MADFYDEFRELADEMLQEFGTDTYLLKQGERTGPEYRPQVGPPTRHRIRTVRVSKTITSPADPRISVTRNNFFISGSFQHRIEVGDRIETPTGTLTIADVKEIAPIFKTILWVVKVEG